ncbi:MAG TPA: hypothetical protein VI455_03925, partial [Terriglobia bacterium]
RLWVAIHQGERAAGYEGQGWEASLGMEPATGGSPPGGLTREPAWDARAAGGLGELLERVDGEAAFEAEGLLARVSEALRRLLVARFPDPLEGPESASGRRWTLRDEFERLRPAAVWFDAEARQALREDLGLEPYAEDFETPEPPQDFLHHRRKFLDELGYICYVRECVW